MPTPLSQRPWLVRFAWGGIIVLLLLIPVVGYVCWRHVSGASELRRVQEVHAREGRGSTIQDLLADIPESDAGRHEQWWRWQGKIAAYQPRIEKFITALDSDDARKWKLGLSTDPPTELTNAFDQVKDLVPEVEALLDAGPFIAGAASRLGSAIHADDPDWRLRAYMAFEEGGYGRKPDTTFHLLDFYVLRFVNSALEFRALSADSPTSCSQALRRMDHLIEALSHPVGLLETILLLQATTRRDDAYLAAVLRRSLSDDEFATWLADERSARSLMLVATAFKAERLLRSGFLEPSAHSGALHDLEWGGRRRLSRLEAWMDGPAGLAICCEAMADVERRIERGPSHPLDLDRWREAATWNLVAKMITPNLIECGITAAESRFIADRTRVIAIIVHQALSSEPPAGTPELRVLLGPHASLLDPSDDRCAMSYTRMTEDRFRVGLDYARSTDGVFTPLDRYRSLSKAATYSRPRGTPPPPRTDLPPKSRGMADMEIWIPRSISE